MNMAKVQFYFNEVKFTLNNRTRLKAFIEQIFKKEKIALGAMNYVFVTDEFLLEMNRAQLRHDYYTDIITFCLSDKGQPISGEAYISIDRIKDNASILKTPFRTELHRVIFHGALHLCGYKDKKPSDTKKMREAEEKYLKAYKP